LNLPVMVEVAPASQQEQSVLANLYQLYIHDFTDFVAQPLGDDGRFAYNPLPSYWTEPARYPFLVRVDGKLSGFALVKKGSDFSRKPDVWDMADFFVVRGVRGKGVGYKVATSIWQQFPGLWEIRVIPTNLPARHFWAKSIARFLGRTIEGETIEPELITQGTETRHVFLFACCPRIPS
jgi:predicted acetyltransferase